MTADAARPATDRLPLLVRVAEWTARRRGVSRLALSMLFGMLSALTMPPMPGWSVILLWVAFPGLLWLLAGQRGPFKAFWTGWFFGFGFFFVSLYWVPWALTVDIEQFGALIPLAAIGLPTLLGIFTGLVTAFYVLLRPRSALAQVLVFAALWGLGEWLRGHVLTGFPWNLTGYAWVGVPPILQSVAVVGIYGLGLMTVLVAALPAVLRRRPGGSGLSIVAAGVVGLVALFAAGTERLARDDGRVVPGVTVRLVQPNIDQGAKWDPALVETNFGKLLALSAAPSASPVTAVIWPETAVPYFLSRRPDVAQAIGRVLPEGGIALVGGVRVSDPAIPDVRFWNSVYALDRTGRVLATYDKSHLVPFGEYVPLRSVLPIERIVPGRYDFMAGSGPRTLEVPGLPAFGPLVCYEVIFPEEIVSAEGPRPQWLLNVTNDGWYGLTAGPHQHFAIAQTRAVEQGLPLVRVANTGISGVVDPYGRITTSIALGTEGVVDAPLPAALARPTPYAQWGDAGFWLLVALNLAIGLTINRRSA